MPFPDLPPERIPGSPGHVNDHQLIDQALDYIQQSGYRDDPNFPPLPDVPVLGQSGHVTAHDRILAVLQYVRDNAAGAFTWATVSNTPTGTYKGTDGHTYAYYLFESDGTLTVTTAGLLEVLLVGGGGGGSAAYSAGVGGLIINGLHLFDAGSVSATVGKAGRNSSSAGETLGQGSALGSQRTGLAGVGEGGAGPSRNVPYSSLITGKTLYVSGRTNSSPVPSYGAAAVNGSAPQPGVVIAKTRLN